MSYHIVDNKIDTPEGCELNVVYQCNLSCRSCSHLSPTFKKEFVDPGKVFDDFSILAKYYHPKYIKLLGGEPLLHPELIQVINAIRNSGISKRIQVCTNGQLLTRMPNLFWQNIDELKVSLYPGKELSKEDLKEIQHSARTYDVDVEFLYIDNFRESYSELGTRNTELVHRIYSTCKIAHIWRCHTVAEGYFYKCPLSFFLPNSLNNKTLKPYKDGIKITDYSEFSNDLLAYLNSSDPLSSCYHCLGTVGKLFAHEQQERKTWRLQQQYPTEEIIDMEYLNTLEKYPEAPWGCGQLSREYT